MRIENLSSNIIDLLNLQQDKDDAKRAAKLCKADLVTGMVFEFTELQGIMGREYARVSGESFFKEFHYRIYYFFFIKF